MHTYDFSPLFRYSIGFDRVETLLASAVSRADRGTAYPPYNIEAVTENCYRISMAVAGFSESDLEIVQTENSLRVIGRASEDAAKGSFLHHGIASRAFERRFDLADHVKVVGASLENGMLTINLERDVPEGLKPRSIKINKGTSASLIGKTKKLLGQEEEVAA